MSHNRAGAILELLKTRTILVSSDRELMVSRILSCLAGGSLKFLKLDP